MCEEKPKVSFNWGKKYERTKKKSVRNIFKRLNKTIYESSKKQKCFFSNTVRLKEFPKKQFFEFFSQKFAKF